MMTNNNACTVVEPSQFPIKLTAKATEMARLALIENAAEDGDILRISVRGGGCAGFQYGLNFVRDIDATDLLMIDGDLKVATDVFSSGHLQDTTVDYVETLQGAGFKFENKNAKRTCGCGSSFTA